MDNAIVPITSLVLIAGVLSIELGISTAILEIISGVIAANLFDIRGVEWLEFLANIGILGIMFFAGFETELRVLKKHYKKSIAIATASYFTPFIVTYGVCSGLLGLDMTASMLISIGMSTTSLALVYPYLETEGLLKMDIAQILLAAAMMVDLFSMFSLSFLIMGFDVEILVFVIIIAIALNIMPRVAKWLSQRYGETKAEIELRFIMLSLVGLAFFSEHVGIHAAILAYMAGLVFSSILEDTDELDRKMRGIVYAFFGPLFFFNSGLIIDLSIFDYNALKLMALFTFIAFTGKYVGTRLSVKYVLGRGSRLASLFFNYRLSFGIVVALLGYRQGIIDETLYMACMGTILATSIISSIFLKITPTETIYKRKK